MQTSPSGPSSAPWRIVRILVGFAALAYLFSWSLWLIQARGGVGPPLRALHLVGSLGPAAAGLAFAWFSGGRPALRRLVRRILLWRVGLGWHALAWLSPFVVLLAAQVLARLGGAEIIPGTLATSPEYPDLPAWLYGLCVLFFYGFGEEVGWRGFALPLLQARLHPIMATLVLSLIWAVWHWPLFLFSPGLSALGIAGALGWFFSLVTGAFLLTWLFNGSGGSVLIAAVFHATMDIAFLGRPEVVMIVGALTTFAGIAAFAAVLRQGRDGAISDDWTRDCMDT